MFAVLTVSSVLGFLVGELPLFFSCMTSCTRLCDEFNYSVLLPKRESNLLVDNFYTKTLILISAIVFFMHNFADDVSTGSSRPGMHGAGEWLTGLEVGVI